MTKSFLVRRGREYLPDLACISFVVLITTLIPKLYNRIPIVWLRVVLTLIAIITALGGCIYIILRIIQRHKDNQMFHAVRTVLVLGGTFLILALIARGTVGGNSLTGMDGPYAIHSATHLRQTIRNSIAFAIISQMIFTCFGAGYLEHREFVIKATKSLVYVGPVLTVASMILLELAPGMLWIKVIYTILLWMVALVGNEMIDGVAPKWLTAIRKNY